MKNGIDTMTQRAEWIDVTRFICAFVVLSQHMALVAQKAYFLPRYIGMNLLWDFAQVPCFFVLSGYFVKHTTSLINFKRVYRLLIPTLFWAFTGAILLLGAHGIGTLDWWIKALGITSSQARAPFIGDPVNGPLWFMNVLILFTLIASTLKRLSPKWQIAVVMICVIMGRHYPVLASLSYFSMGILLANIPLKCIYNALEKAYIPIVIVAVTAPLLLLARKGGSTCWIYGGSTIWLGILFMLSLGILVCKINPKLGSIMASWGRYAFFIYVAHWPLEILYVRTCSTWPVWVGSLVPTAIAAALLVIGYFAEKYIPKTAALLLMIRPASKHTQKHNGNGFTG